MDVERLREALNRKVFWRATEDRIEIQPEQFDIIVDAARDHLACGTVTDEMVDKAKAGIIDWRKRHPLSTDLANVLNPTDGEIRAGLEAVFRVETGEQE